MNGFCANDRVSRGGCTHTHTRKGEKLEKKEEEGKRGTGGALLIALKERTCFKWWGWTKRRIFLLREKVFSSKGIILINF